MHCVMLREEETGDQLDDAIYRRNRKVEDKLDIKINEILANNDYKFEVIMEMARNSVLSGEDEYQAMYLPVNKVSNMAFEGSFYNLLEIDSLQLDKPWWYSNFNDAITINNALYSAVGGSHLMIHDGVRVLTFNEDMTKNLGLEMPYDLVREGKWTLDALNKYISAAANLNGAESAEWNNESKTIYGMTNMASTLTFYFLGCGVDTVISDNGVLKSSIGTSRWYDVLDKLSTMFTSDDAKFRAGFNGNDADPTQGGYIYAFMNQRTLFGVSEVNKFQRYRSLDFEYGVLPFPKYDENQDSYYSMMYTSSHVAHIPITNPNPEIAGFVLDALSYESEISVVPTFREVAIETKGLRNGESIEMLKIITDSIVAQPGSLLGLNGSINTDLSNAVVNHTGTYASIFAQYEDQIQANIDNVMKNWNK